jgi:hypothetical protein
MAENTRVRIEQDIEAYLKSQAIRVLGKEGEKITGAELSTVANRIIYEHRIAQGMARKVPFTKLFNWLMGLTPGSGSRVVALQTSSETPALQPSKPDPSDFDEDSFASKFEVDLELDKDAA